MKNEFTEFPTTDYNVLKSFDFETLKASGVDLEELEDSLVKALEKQGLVPKRITVQGKNGPYEKTVMVRPDKASDGGVKKDKKADKKDADKGRDEEADKEEAKQDAKQEEKKDGGFDREAFRAMRAKNEKKFLDEALDDLQDLDIDDEMVKVAENSLKKYIEKNGGYVRSVKEHKNGGVSVKFDTKEVWIRPNGKTVTDR